MLQLSRDRFHYQSGQIGIIIILIMLVLLTFGLSIAARSSKEVILSQQEEESNRVFNGAETGAEQALSSNLNFTGNTTTATNNTSDSTVSYTIAKNTVLETRIPQGGTGMVQLPAAGTAKPVVYIDWSKETDCASPTSKPASLIVVMYLWAGTTYRAQYLTFAACNNGDGMGADVAGTASSYGRATTAGSNGYYKRATITIPAGWTGNNIIMRIKSVYNDTNVRVSASAALPTQMYDIRSEGKNTKGNETRAVEVNRTLNVAPSVMDYAIFTEGNLVK